ncbi:MAG TPA: YoaK family protein, partial [Ilumatobacteraceae bacterium]|nr:YoaK family protein [Ilumatobacteraceae bacterium]
RHLVSGSLWVAMGLAVTAGYVDAFVYRNVMPVFVANMSGNLIKFGMAIGDVDVHAVVAAAIALAAFSLAATAGAAVIDRRLSLSSRAVVDPAPLLLAEVVLLTALTLVAVIAHPTLSERLTGDHILIVAFGSAAMGLQAVSLRRVGDVAVSTTYGTGAIVRMAEKTALAFRRSARDHDVPRRHSVLVLSCILAWYLIGAAIAAAIAEHRALLGILPAINLLIAWRVHHIDRRGLRKTDI